MESKIVYASELADQARAKGGSYSEAAKHVRTEVLKDHPIHLSIVTAVDFDSKTDRYVVKFAGYGQSKSSSAKVTNEVAEFLLRERWHPARSAAPDAYAHMTDGKIDSVLLLFLSRE